MKILNKRDFSIKISGNHYFACDYVFSNVYGESVFLEEPEQNIEANEENPMSALLNEEALLDTLPETPYDAISTMPDCTKEIEFITEGSVQSESENDLYIRYGSDECPMCIHIRDDGSVTLSGDDGDVAEIVFEKGKRNFIALTESLFSGAIPMADTDEYEPHAPLHLCVTTEQIDNKMTSSGGSLTVSYSIDVNGIVAEVTDFTITANNITGLQI